MGAGGNENVMDNSERFGNPRFAPQPASDGITMPQVTSFAKQLCDQLSGQGYADKTVLEVLSSLPYTIKQIRERIP